jgi:hypothetical protein
MIAVFAVLVIIPFVTRQHLGNCKEGFDDKTTPVTCPGKFWKSNEIDYTTFFKMGYKPKGCGWSQDPSLKNKCPAGNCSAPDNDTKTVYCLSSSRKEADGSATDFSLDWGAKCPEYYGLSKSATNVDYTPFFKLDNKPKGCGWSQDPTLKNKCPAGNYHGGPDKSKNVYCLDPKKNLKDMTTVWEECPEAKAPAAPAAPASQATLETPVVPSAAGSKYMGCGWNQPFNASDQSFFTETQKSPNGKAGACSYGLQTNEKKDKICLNPKLKGSDINTEWTPKTVKGKVYLEECQNLMNKIGKDKPPSKPPVPTPHNTEQHISIPKMNIGSNVYNNMQEHKYKKFIPDDLDHNSLNREKYEAIGKNFIKDEAKSKGVKPPPIHDSEAEILGRMVWRVYAAEMEEKRTKSQKAKDAVMEQEIQLLSKVSKFMKNETDHHKGKKHQGLGCNASEVPDNSPKHYPSKRTDNMFGYTPNEGNNVKREEGHAFEGHPVAGLPRYFDQTNAVEHCFNDHRCGGVNYDSTTGEYSLMPKHARLIKKNHFTAFIKEDKHHGKHHGGHHGKHHGGHHGKHHGGAPDSPYQPITGIGSPRDPNLLPRPYNSLMDLFG